MAGRTGYTATPAAFDPQVHMDAIYGHFDPLIGETRADAASLPASGNWVGRTIMTLDMNVVWRCTALPGVWKAPASGIGTIIPSSVTGGSVNATTGEITFAASTGISIDGCFLSASKNYRIVVDVWSKSTGGKIQGRMRLGGVDAAVASTYNSTLVQGASGSAASASVSSSAFDFTFSTSGIEDAFETVVYSAAAARVTRLVSTVSSTFGGGVQGVGVVAARHSTAVAYDGISILAGAGNMTGSIKIYEMN